VEGPLRSKGWGRVSQHKWIREQICMGKPAAAANSLNQQISLWAGEICAWILRLKSSVQLKAETGGRKRRSNLYWLNGSFLPEGWKLVAETWTTNSSAHVISVVNGRQTPTASICLSIFNLQYWHWAYLSLIILIRSLIQQSALVLRLLANGHLGLSSFEPFWTASFSAVIWGVILICSADRPLISNRYELHKYS